MLAWVLKHALVIRDNAVIAVGSANPNLDDRGRAGNLHIVADQLQADDHARLLANTNSGRGGDITLAISNLLLLNQNSQISTTAGSERRGGNGGDITLDTTFLIASLNANNDIAANAFTGNGGRITINALSIVGLIPTDTLTPRSDSQSNITASSALGVNGEISINSPNIDPTRGLQLPDVPIDEPPLAQGCLTTTNAASERSSFVISGRGGLPPSPYEFLGSDDLWQDWRLTDVEPETESDRSATAVSSSNPQTAEIIEAQGWVRNAAGQVELVAQAPQPDSASFSQFLPNCSRVSHASPTP